MLNSFSAHSVMLAGLTCVIYMFNDILRGTLGSGYGNHGSFSGGGMDCCPLVVDPLTFAALTGFIGLATYFLERYIAMSMLMMARKKRRKRALNLNEDTIVHETIDIFSGGKPDDEKEYEKQK